MPSTYLSQKPLVGVLGGHANEAGGREDDADHDPDGGAHEAQHQLDVGQHQPHQQRGGDDAHR